MTILARMHADRGAGASLPAPVLRDACALAQSCRLSLTHGLSALLLLPGLRRTDAQATEERDEGARTYPETMAAGARRGPVPGSGVMGR